MRGLNPLVFGVGFLTAFVVVRQENGERHIAIDPGEWPALREAITRLVCTAQGLDAATLGE